MVFMEEFYVQLVSLVFEISFPVILTLAVVKKLKHMILVFKNMLNSPCWWT
jgi:hypothetical protein